MCTIILLTSSKVREIHKSISLLSKESTFIMDQLNSDIISATSNNLKTNGFSSTTKEWDNSIHMISNSIVLVGSTGEDRVKVPTCLSIRKSSKNPSDYNSTQNKNSNKFSINFLWKILFTKFLKKSLKKKRLPKQK